MNTLIDWDANPKDDIGLAVAIFMHHLEEGSVVEGTAYPGMHNLSRPQAESIIEELVECGSVVRRDGRLYHYEKA